MPRSTKIVFINRWSLLVSDEDYQKLDKAMFKNPVRPKFLQLSNSIVNLDLIEYIIPGNKKEEEK